MVIIIIVVVVLVILLPGVVFLKIDAVNLSYYIGGICSLYWL